MPQFDPTYFVSQLFWLLVTFVAMYWVIARYAIPRVGEILEQRERVISEDLNRAQQLKREADEAAEAYERAMADARSQASEAIRKATDEMKAAAETRNSSVNADLSAQVSEAERRIAVARDQALDSIRSVAAENAREVVRRLTGVDVAEDRAEQAAAAALAENR